MLYVAVACFLKTEWFSTVMYVALFAYSTIHGHLSVQLPVLGFYLKSCSEYSYVSFRGLVHLFLGEELLACVEEMEA